MLTYYFITLVVVYAANKCLFPKLLVWRKGNINENCLCVTVLCTIIMVHEDASGSYRSVDCIRL